MTEILDTKTGELVPIKMPEIVVPAIAATLFGTNDPDEMMVEIKKRADILLDVVHKQKLSVVIQGREFVRVEGWTFLGSLCGVFGVVPLGGVTQLSNGWMAHVDAKRLDGSIVGGADAICLRSERTWADRPDTALCAMSQTRAMSRALRGPLGFIVQLAGFDPLGAEEVPKGGFPDAKPEPAKAVRKPRTKKVQDPVPAEDDLASAGQVRNMFRLIDKLDKSELIPRETLLEAIGKEYGTESPVQLTKAEANDLITRLKARAGETE